MPDWSDSTREAFLRAERALVSAQVRGWRNVHPWAAWGNIAQGHVTQYGALLADGRFDEIEQLASQLTA
jgi:hypothetical protein